MQQPGSILSISTGQNRNCKLKFSLNSRIFVSSDVVNFDRFEMALDAVDVESRRTVKKIVLFFLSKRDETTVVHGIGECQMKMNVRRMNENCELSLTDRLQRYEGSSEKLLNCSLFIPISPRTNFLTCQVYLAGTSPVCRLPLSKPHRNFISVGLGKMDRERGKSIGKLEHRAIERFPVGREESTHVSFSPSTPSPSVVLRLGACPVALIL